jgi:SAM-dependent methyltransferase
VTIVTIAEVQTQQPRYSGSNSMIGTLSTREEVVACPVCGSPDRTASVPSADVWQCLSCDTLFVSPRPTASAIEAFYSAPGRYDRWDAERGRAAMWRRRLDRMKRLSPAGGRLLDVGTGQGDFVTAAMSHFDAEATEISTEGARIARTRHKAVVHVGDLLELSLPSDRYDVITLWHVLEHVARPRDLVAECRRLLKRGGILAVAVPNADEDWQFTRRLWSRARQFACHRTPTDGCSVPLVDLGLFALWGRIPRRRISLTRLDLEWSEEQIHLTHFTLETLERLLNGLGLAVVERGIDDHSPHNGLLARTRHRRERVAFRLTGRVSAPAIFVAGRRA